MEDQSPHLLDLVPLGLAVVVRLQVDDLKDSRLGKNMMASLDSLFESQIADKFAQVLKADIRVRFTGTDSLFNFFVLAQRHEF